MKILFFTHYFYPHIGGVEKHALRITEQLIKNKDEVVILTENYDRELKLFEDYQGIKIIRFNYPKVKYVGLIYIWLFLIRNIFLVNSFDVIHIHDVFIWILPVRILLFWKKIYITIHGLEWENPTSFSGIIQKKIAISLCKGNIGVGKFIEKYAKVKFDLIIYGATDIYKICKKNKNEIVFIGRLARDTGVLEFLEYLKTNKKLKPIFVGDGDLRKQCEEYGKVTGFTDPGKYLEKSEYACVGGYLSCLEAFSAKCKVKVFWNTKLKEDYWKMSPMWKYIKNEDIDGAYKFAKKHSWKKLTNEYTNLWKK